MLPLCRRARVCMQCGICWVHSRAPKLSRKAPWHFRTRRQVWPIHPVWPAFTVFPTTRLTEMKIPGGASVIAAPHTEGGELDVWSAGFVGTGIGTTNVGSASAACASTVAVREAGSALQFKWIDCAVTLAPGTPPPAPPGPAPPTSWVEHNASSCSGECLKKNSNGPDGGHCDRLPGCGHDAHLPLCDPVALKARCLNASGCTAFNTNGYLYVTQLYTWANCRSSSTFWGNRYSFVALVCVPLCHNASPSRAWLSVSACALAIDCR
jgi:hypothetical protein